ncbi:WW domain-binding protein 2-like [Daphnia pulex]|uniref:WW domain-binding protein 2-like n=1 Tax=Daphnia pulex TaxID=6669 RepID=UPI001EDF9DC9|nr:WW domain-binding protein 2-like [Daphnia pulex]XP_046449396.1 WW domain-binding protein 2-like [Daphnia pulex]XP_046449398.1 WW domain-binding protein 2-like [Daphnia pulex]
MSLNTAHANNGVLIYAGECILLYCDNVVMEFSGQDRPEFKGDKAGRLYLTTHRMIFNSSTTKDPLQSFSFPFCTMKDVELEQPMFGANYIKGKVRAQPNGGWVGEVKFKLHFKHGGAIEYGQAMLQAASITKRNHQYSDEPPAYQPPSGPWHNAPPPAYSTPNGGYYGWVPPPTNAFPNAPPANSVFMTDMPPPYPGIYPGNANNGYAPSSNDAKAAEAAASGTAYYDPNTHYAYVPPAYSNDAPPSYEESKDKKFK